MHRAATLSILFTAVSFLTAMPSRAQAACTADSDHCQQAHTSVVAIAHSYTAPATTVLFRVKVPAWSPGKKWGDGHNGFFYRATAYHAGGGTTVTDYTPFNGIRVGTDGEPALPPFDFIVPIDVSDGGTTLQIAACSSDPAAGSSSVTPQCKTTYWTDPYDPLPTPAVTSSPPVSVGFGTLTLGGSGAVSLANNGVYTDHIKLQVDTSLTQAQLDWLFDHLVYFDAQGNAYTNDLLDQGIGILPLDEAAYVSPQDQKRHAKYGTGNAVSVPTAPDEELFFYTTLAQTTNIGITVIYDSSDTCTGYIAGNGSQNVNCSTRVPPPPNISPKATVTGYAWRPDSTSVTGTAAGIGRQRTVQMQVQTAVTDTSANCRPVLSPLGVAPSQAGGAQRPPNYVIDDYDWTRRFPNGLYYVLGTGFGNCDLSKAAPFCGQSNNGVGYVGYIPHYLDDGVGGTLNGGSNSGPEVTAIDLADEYEIGDVATAAQNALVFFDGCGYGHRYEEPNVNTTLGTRMTLPDAPKGFTKTSFTVANNTGRAVVFAKQCCATWYQSNDQTNTNEPVQQLDDGFGVFLPAGASVPYETIFPGEAMAVYDAATGEPLFKLWLKGSSSVVYDCSDSSSSVVVSGSGSPLTLGLGATGSGAKKCQSLGKCPLLMATSQSGSLVTCTTKTSNILFSLNDWKAKASLPNKIQLRAWGARGHDGNDDYKGSHIGGDHGFALTVYRPSDLPDSLFAYVGTYGNQKYSGGASSILTTQPLSLFGSKVAENTTDPTTMGVLLIGGGGGSSGTTHDGGAGAVAIANSTSVPGGPSSTAGQKGKKDNGGKGGNNNQEGSGGSAGGNHGVGGTSYGTSAQWFLTGSIIPPTVDPLSWSAGHGSHGNHSSGGGGFGGGGHGSTDASGGGGGGSWATGNTVYDSSAPSGLPTSPNGDHGAIQFAYVAPTAAVAPAPLSSSSAHRNVLRLVFSASVTPLDLPTVVQRLLGSGIGGDVPVYIEAWGGSGGVGGTDGAAGGASGYARTAYTLSDLLAMSNGAGLYLYVGDHGADGEQLGEPGQGGASSIVSLGPIADGVATPQGQGVLLISGGGGGGGAGGAADDPTAQSGGGGAGGSAIATLQADASCGGSDGQAVVEGGEAGGGGGNGGGAACDAALSGGGGSAGAEGGAQGSGGVGGFGGATGANISMPSWGFTGPSDWNAGDGAASSTLGGGGGGGFGGGGSGGVSMSRGFGGGGGGGGSWARQATADVGDAPILGPLNSSGANGEIALTFDVCKVHPDSQFCTSGAGFVQIDPQVRMFDEGNGQVRVRILGSDSVDVSKMVVGRFLFGNKMVVPEQVSAPADLNGDGIDDLELTVESNDLASEVVHCVYGSLGGTTPFVGCARVEAAACAACGRDECIDGACPAQASPPPETDSGCAIAVGRHAGGDMGGLLLCLFGVFLLVARRRATRAALRAKERSSG